MGQPFRIGFLDDILRHVRRRKGVWSASGGEIVEWYSQEGTK